MQLHVDLPKQQGAEEARADGLEAKACRNVEHRTSQTMNHEG